MRQYEVAIRIAQVHHLADERKYRKALTVIQTLDMRQIRNVSDLKVFAEVYTRTEQLAEAKATYLRIYKKSRTRKTLYRLIYLAIRTNNLEEAEKYYEEFVRMNPSNRDALILRYRLDKAAGVQIGQLIDTLRDLKEEEYIEEWAYELAKLYQQAGRYEECREECADIKLWFGSGEIVERAKLLLDHIQENDPMPFLDDTDFTDPLHREKPNPDDTGSLPDLSEYLESSSDQEMKLLKKADPAKFEEIISEKVTDKGFDAESDNTDSSQDKKPEGLQKLSGLLFGNKATKAEDEDHQNEDAGQQVEQEMSESAEEQATSESDDLVWELERPSEDVAETIATAEQELAPTMSEDGMGQGADKNIDMEALESEKAATEEVQRTDRKIEIDPSDFPSVSQSGTGITQDLAKEISAIYEAERQAQLREKTVSVIQELPNVANDVVERMTEAVAQSETKQYVPLDAEETTVKEDLSGSTVVVPDLTGESESGTSTPMEQMAEKLPDPSGDTQESAIETIARQLREAEAFEKLPEETEQIAEEEGKAPSELHSELQLLKALEQELQEAEAKIEKTVAIADKEIEAAAGEEAIVTATAKEVIAAVETNLQNHEDSQPQVTNQGQIAAGDAANTAEVATTGQESPAVDKLPQTAGQQTQAGVVSAAAQSQQKPAGSETANTPQKMAADRGNTGQSPQEPAGQPAQTTAAASRTAGQPQPAGGTAEAAATTEAGEASSEVQSATGEVLPEKDLPTTRALHRSFDDVLILIGGEMDPSHFVLIGDGKERILGISKKIAVVMRETGYLSSGRIAHIAAEQLNVMDLSQFKKQLKGNCLLITNAAELLFPTITRVFSIMDEFYGDFTVILSDEGATLDQLFRFVPALARRFKYVIDITQYTEKDYKM